MESRLKTKHKENKRLRPTYGVCVAIVCVSDVDICDGSRIDRPQYVGHCSNRLHHRPDTCKETGDRYELVSDRNDRHTNKPRTQTNRQTNHNTCVISKSRPYT